MKSRTWTWTTVVYLFTALAMAVNATPLAQAQTLNVIHSFSGGADGGNPYAGLTMDRAGNLYGTASAYGKGSGTVYRLKRSGSNWVFNLLYSFAGGTDGADPEARVVFGPDGTLYGTTLFGGIVGCGPNGCGTVFNLRPPLRACAAAVCPWTETILHRFAGGSDGNYPEFSDLIFDQTGNGYGATYDGGPSGLGTVFELTPSGGGWTENVLYGFPGTLNDGVFPNAVTLDAAGDIYGTTFNGGSSNQGAVFELNYSVGTGWKENLLYSFQNESDGALPIAGLIPDESGNLYGTTTSGGSGGGGTVFELTPFNGIWTYSLIYTFAGPNGCGPEVTLAMDGAGSLYGTTVCDGANQGGNVFKLARDGGIWTYTSLHDFTGGNDGANPYGSLVFGGNGSLYGTAYGSGPLGYGVVFEIVP